ncbi:RNA polymerase II elongation factor ELL-like [Limulus polyphemus]|uniref:RNA polymerase II elongation factor ELL-like n=1 Tax=Limulus polyphemus TaxID=6850 RepID=A0ABM1BWD8_LIMPO|nr:RNA polymerase II elongation factor ELL-like [Limulus polyphemus]
MAALVEGQQYGLSSQGSNSSNKSLIFVKLTDSGLRSIEEYLKNRGSTPKKPTIQFDDSRGVIRLPGVHNSQQSFGFTLSNIEADNLQGSFECLQQKGSRLLESVGSMMHKMQICANEDSYEKTRAKMAVAEQENKKNCTKIIKASGPYVGRKVKMKRPILSVPPPKPSSPPPHSAFPLSRPVPKPFPSASSLHMAATGNHSKPAVQQKSNNPDILRRTYRERVIHLLALRPYKKPELLARLMKDGIKEKDKKSLSAILSQVAVLKGNTFHIARYIWNEVSDDWPFYSAEELKLMKRQKPQNLTPPSESENRFPCLPQEYDSSVAQKRMSPSAEPHPAKKQRISHYKKPEQFGSISANSSGPDPPCSKSNFVNANCYKADLAMENAERPENHERTIYLNKAKADSPMESISRPDSNSRPKYTNSYGRPDNHSKISWNDSIRTSTISEKYSVSQSENYPLSESAKYSVSKSEKVPVFHSEKYPVSESAKYPVSHGEKYPIVHSEKNPLSPREKYGMAKSEKYPTSHSEKYPTSHSEKYPTSHSEKYPTSHSEKYPTSHSRKYSHVSRVEKSPTSHSESIPTSLTVESNPTSHSEKYPTSHSEKYPTSHSEKYPTSHSEKYPTSHSEKYPTSHSEKYPTSHSEKYPTSHSEKYPTSHSEKYLGFQSENHSVSENEKNCVSESERYSVFQQNEKHRGSHSPYPMQLSSERTCSPHHSIGRKSHQRIPEYLQSCDTRVTPVESWQKDGKRNPNPSSLKKMEPKSDSFFTKSYSSLNKSFPEEKFKKQRLKTSSKSCGSVSGDSSPASSPDSQSSVDSSGFFSSNGEDLDYLGKFVVISNNEQRARYKADFNAEYEEYCRLHGILVDVSKRFATLDCTLRQFEEGSDDWEQIMHQIKVEYKENRRKQYHHVKKRFQYLHNKLSHIKRLIMDYDQAQR